MSWLSTLFAYVLALAISLPFQGYWRLVVFALALTAICGAIELTREKGV